MQLWSGRKLLLLMLLVWLIVAPRGRRKPSVGWTVGAPESDSRGRLTSLSALTAASSFGGSDLVHLLSSPARLFHMGAQHKLMRSAMRKHWWRKDHSQPHPWTSLRSKAPLHVRQVPPLICTPWTKVSVQAGEFYFQLSNASGPSSARGRRFSSTRCSGNHLNSLNRCQALCLNNGRCANHTHLQQHFATHTPLLQVLLHRSGARGCHANVAAGALLHPWVPSPCWVPLFGNFIGVRSLMGPQQCLFASPWRLNLCDDQFLSHAPSSLRGSSSTCRMHIEGSFRCHLGLKSPAPVWTGSICKAQDSLVTDLSTAPTSHSSILRQSWYGATLHINQLLSSRELMRTRGSRGGRRDRRRKRPRDVERESGRPPRRLRQAQASEGTSGAHDEPDSSSMSDGSDGADDAPRLGH